MLAPLHSCVQFVALPDGRLRVVVVYGAATIEQLRFVPDPHATVADAVGLDFWLRAVVQSEPIGFLVPWTVSALALDASAPLIARCEAVMAGFAARPTAGVAG